MVGIVVVSHSAELARGVVELARQMGGEEVGVEEAGGMDDGSIGTDAARVQAAIERAMSDDGVLVLMDLGSALMSAEMAVELMEGDARVVLSDAPLVEGAVAAAAAARGGASLEEVRAEAGRAFAMKQAQLGGDEATPPSAEPAAALSEPDARAAIPVLNEIGLHARPAALVVELAGRFDADLRLAKEGGPGPVSARSLTGLMTLMARKGDRLSATASGPQASEAVAALQELAGEGFGEGVAASAPAPAPEPPASEPPVAAAAPEDGEVLSGIAASAGIALGPARHLGQGIAAAPSRASQGADVERGRLDEALIAAREAIEHDRDTVAGRGAVKEAEIFTAHIALLGDEALVGRARALIEGGDSAEAAWHAAGEETAAQWRALGDKLLAERAADVDDVGRRVLTALAGGDAGAALQEAGIVVADELTPRDTAALDPDLVQAVATARGTATAHAAILARALGIPAVVGLGGSVLAIAEGTPLLLDGQAGTVLVSPDEAQAAAARSRAADLDERRRVAREHAREPTVMRDGTVIEVFANLGGAGQASVAVEMGAEGVGLLRTEFLFLERAKLPSEDEQVETLATIATDLAGRPLIVRTLDVGADKPLQAVPMEPEANPFLGRRGLRLSLARPELFLVQLRAILRVAAEHPLKVMFPMVSTAAELDAALALLEQARAETGVRAELEAGIMVEVPAAALLAEQLATRAQFFSVGTNDLTQYTMAAERGNELVGDLLAGAQPAVLRLIRLIAAGAAVHGRTLAVCGELAGDPAAAVLLVGLGVRELSMAPPLIAEVKQALRSVTLVDAITAADHAVNAPDATAARAVADALL
jgi:phosphoenolpyruvate-protein phosphotransferase/dihydroxyacetone kinase phosphotransfer subunit